MVNNDQVVLTNADVSYEWITPGHDWARHRHRGARRDLSPAQARPPPGAAGRSRWRFLTLSRKRNSPRANQMPASRPSAYEREWSAPISRLHRPRLLQRSTSGRAGRADPVAQSFPAAFEHAQLSDSAVSCSEERCSLVRKTAARQGETAGKTRLILRPRFHLPRAAYFSAYVPHPRLRLLFLAQSRSRSGQIQVELDSSVCNILPTSRSCHGHDYQSRRTRHRTAR